MYEPTGGRKTMELPCSSTLRVLIVGQQKGIDQVLAANIRCWGYSVNLLPTALPLLSGAVDCDVVLYDLDEAFRLATLLGNRGVQLDQQWTRRILTIVLSSRSVSRTALEEMGAVAFLLKPFEMGQLQQYLRVMQRVLFEPQVPTTGDTKRRILVVDDAEGVVNVIRRLLLSVGYSVAVAHNGLEALELCVDWRPQCIVTDVIMPWMNGYQVIRCLAAGAARPLPSFVIMSALGQLEVPVNDSYLQGIPLTYVNKPFTIDKLLTAIEQVCDDRVL